MKLELLSTANFLVHLLRLAKRNVSESKLQKFRENLIEVLRRRYRDHWFPEKPFKGSGYRCIRINGKMDPVVGQAGERCGLSSTFLHSTYPNELTMWIDPLEVSYRIGENGRICLLYVYSEGVTEPWIPEFLRKDKKRKKNKLEQQVTVNSGSDNPAYEDDESRLTSNKDDCNLNLRMDFLLYPKKCVSIEELAAMMHK